MSDNVVGGADLTRETKAAWLVDALLMALLVAICFVLGCCQPIDADLWWHLRGGQWIIEHKAAPGLDPFTYSSADRVWIDLHWLYEVLLAIVFRLRGIPGVAFLAAATAAASVAAALAANRRGASAAVIAIAWIPAVLLMSARLNLRPETFSLLFVALFLAVLAHADRHPRWLWLLPPVQLLWVNVQGLFVLGPVVLMLFIFSSVFDAWRQRGLAASSATVGRQWWQQVLGASLGVAIACLINPYGIRGALLPLELFPKISDPTSPYKIYIDEFHSPLADAHRVVDYGFDHLIYFNVLYFLLLAVPLSFVFPAIWRACGAGVPPALNKQAGAPPAPRKQAGRLHHKVTEPARWLAAFVAAIGVIAAGAAVACVPAGPGWVSLVATCCPIAMLVLSLAAAVALSRLACSASALAFASGLPASLAMYYLQARMSAGEIPNVPSAAWGLCFLAALAAAALVVWHGGNLFRLLLAAAFGYLSLQAMRNLNLFGLVAGAILSLNLNDWMASLRTERDARPSPTARWGPRAAVACLLTFWLLVIPTTAYHAWTGDRRVFSLQEPELLFPHDAARFAGRDGMPDRALACHLGLAGLYVYENGPAKKVYMDPRLELPTPEVFERYVDIETNFERPGNKWVAPLEETGARVLLLDHGRHHHAEAALLLQGDWRCVYYDALASVFVSKSSGVSPRLFPTVDFAERHFRHGSSPSKPAATDAEFFEASALVKVASHLRREQSVTWSWRVPALWHALDRLQIAEASTAHQADLWSLRGQCHWNLVPDLTLLPPTPADGWTIAALPWAQSTWCFRQALLWSPEHVGTLRQLYDAWRARGMRDAQLAVGQQLPPSIAAAKVAELAALEQELAQLPETLDTAPSDVHASVEPWFARVAVATLAEMVKSRELDTSFWSWDLVDRLAAAWMHLGEPDEARKLWAAARHAPSEAVRAARLADTYLVEREFFEATQLYREALVEAPQLSEAHCGLAMMHCQLGEAPEAFAACALALKCPLDDELRAEFEKLHSALQGYCSGASDAAEAASDGDDHSMSRK